MKFIALCHVSILRGFYFFGTKVGSHPFAFMIGCLIVCGFLASGMTELNPQNDIEVLYTPKTSKGKEDKEIYIKHFEVNATDYADYTSINIPVVAHLIFRTPKDVNILDERIIKQIEGFVGIVYHIEAPDYDYETNSQLKLNYSSLCMKKQGVCVYPYAIALTYQFRKLVREGKITYPFSKYYKDEDLSIVIGQPILDKSKPNQTILLGAHSLYFKFNLMYTTSKSSFVWLNIFLEVMKKQLPNFRNVSRELDVAYSSTISIQQELQKSTEEDIGFFVMTFVLMITYSVVVTSGGDMVSTRAFLSIGGVIAICLGIAATIGFVSMLGVRYVNMVGVTPFLLLGVGVDDIFLLMSCWSETTDKSDMTNQQRVGRVFRKAGIGITITSLTNFMSLTIGAASDFVGVQNFCIYTGIGVLACYLTNVSFFGGCLTLHGRRMNANRHAITCMKIKTGEEANKEGYNCLYKKFCSGNMPNRPMQDLSFYELWPSYFMPRFVLLHPVRILTFILFPVNLGIAIWGCTLLKEGLSLKDLMTEGSYAKTYHDWSYEDYGEHNAVSFVTTRAVNYTNPNTLKNLKELLRKAKQDKLIMSDREICWLTEYAKKKYYDISTKKSFQDGLQRFLNENPRFQKDFGKANGATQATRCHVFSEKLYIMHEGAELMERMRKLAEESPAADFCFYYMYIFYDQFILIFWTTMYTVGLTVIVMGVVSACFLPHPVIVFVVMMQVLMVLTCIFGYMAISDISLSSITMAHLIISVGLSVDFCAHVCSAYMVSEKTTRHERVRDAVLHASGPILNGGTSSLVGVMGLMFSKSFVFRSFFVIICLVIGFGVAHAVFFVPAILSLIGPQNYVQETYGEEDSDEQAKKAEEDPYTPRFTRLSSHKLSDIVPSKLRSKQAKIETEM